MWNEGGASRCDLGITLNHSMVLTRKVPLALGLDKTMVREHLRWEVEQSLVSPLSEYLMDYQRLPFSSSAGHPVYLLVLLRKLIISQIQSLFQTMGVSLVDVDVDLFALIRLLLAQGGVSTDDLVALVDVDAHHLTVVLIYKQDFYLKHVIALDTARPHRKNQRLSDITPVLLKELKRLVFGHRLGGDLNALAHIVITGEGASSTFQEAVAEQTVVPVALLDPFSSLKILPSVADLSKSKKLARHCGPAVGLALKHAALHLQ